MFKAHICGTCLVSDQITRLILSTQAQSVSGRGSHQFPVENLLSRCLDLVDRRFQERETLGRRLSLKLKALLPPLKREVHLLLHLRKSTLATRACSHLIFVTPSPTPDKQQEKQSEDTAAAERRQTPKRRS